MNFWPQNKTVFPIFEKFNIKTFSVISKNHISINFLAQKKTVFPISKLKHYPSRFLKYHATFVNTKERSSFYQLPASKFQEIFNVTFSCIQKIDNMNFFFLLNMNFSFIRGSCFSNNLFLKLMFPLNILKDLDLHYKRNYETKLRNFFSLVF